MNIARFSLRWDLISRQELAEECLQEDLLAPLPQDYGPEDIDGKSVAFDI